MTSKELLSTLQELSLKAKVDPSLEAQVLFELTGPDPAQWMGQIGGGQVKLSDGRPETPDLTITASSETALAIFQKRLNPLMAFMTGKVKVQGDVGKMALLKGLLAGKKKNSEL